MGADRTRGARLVAGSRVAIALLLAGLLPVLAPLLRPGLPATDDGHLHLYRLVAQHTNVAEGGAPSRWLSDVAYGYGAPVFAYYAPLAYAPALAASLLGWGYVTGLKLAFGLPLVASALTMFLLVRALFGATAGLAAGLVYAYLPYQIIDVYVRGALAETATFAWLPLACWCLVRLRRDPGPRWTAATALVIGGLVLTHNIVSLFALPALALLAVALGCPAGATADRARRYALHVGAAFALGVGLGAWYWLPALLEKGLVQTEQALIAPERFLRYFLQSWPPFQVGLAYDYSPIGTEEWGETKLGIVQVALLATGALAAVRTAGVARRVSLWAVGIAVAASLVQARFAAPLFDLVPLVGYIQFPWRLLALVGLATAILAGGLVRLAPTRFGVRPLVALAVVGLSAYAAVAELTPRQVFVDDRYLAAGGALPSELADIGVATTWFGELLPGTVTVAGRAPLRRAVLYTNGLPPARPDPVATHVEMLTWTPTRIRARVDAERPDELLVHQFAYPGWTATIDGVPTQVRPGGRLGVLAVDVPAGSHEVELRFGWTAARLAGLAASVAAGAGLIAMVVAAGLSTRRARRGMVAPALAAGLLVMLAGAVLTAVLDPAGRRAEAAGMGQAAGLSLPVDVDERLSLVGATLASARLASDGSITATLVWLSRAEQVAEYEVRLRVAHADGAAHEAWWDHEPTRRSWDRGELIRTRTDLRLPNGFPAGPARVALAIEPRDAPPLELDLGVVDVPPRRAGAAGPRYGLVPEHEPLDALRLVSYDVRASGPLSGVLGGRGPADLGPVGGRPATDRPAADAPQYTVEPGDQLDVSLDWQVLLLPYRDVIATVELRARREAAPTEPRAVGDWFHPFLGWQVGDRIGQHLRLAVPSMQATGDYDLVLRVASRDRPWVRLRRPAGRSAREVDQGSVSLGTVSVERAGPG